jgi:2,3-bisphosphoglycerate-dependent phosphoglycerate mutase
MATHLINLRFSFSNVSKLVILRHGESLWNKQKKWAGWSDVRLSSKGIAEAKQCGKLLK